MLHVYMTSPQINPTMPRFQWLPLDSIVVYVLTHFHWMSKANPCEVLPRQADMEVDHCILLEIVL